MLLFEQLRNKIIIYFCFIKKLKRAMEQQEPGQNQELDQDQGADLPPDTQNSYNDHDPNSVENVDLNEPIQVSIGTKYIDSPPKTNFQTEEKKKHSSGGGSNLNVYLRHNSALGTNKTIEPVKLNAVKGMQHTRSSQEKTLQQAQARFGDPLSPSRTIDGTVNASVEQPLEYQDHALDQQMAQKFQYMDSLQMLPPTIETLKNASEADHLRLQEDQPEKANLQMIKTQSEAENQIGPSEFQQEAVKLQGNNTCTPDQLREIMLENDVQSEMKAVNKDPAKENAKLEDSSKIQSTPLEQSQNKGDQQLIERFQRQTQELMRIASGGITKGEEDYDAPNSRGETMEQAQQVAMPELQLGEDLLEESLQLAPIEKNLGRGAVDSGPKVTVMPHLLEPKLIGCDGNAILTSNRDISRFMEETGQMSHQTISGPDGGNQASHGQQNMLQSLQKITMPAFISPIDKSHERQQTGTFDAGKNKPTSQLSNLSNIRPGDDKVLIGMVDTDISSPVSPLSGLLGPATLNHNQQIRMVKVPKANQPRLIERNQVGGGTGKYGNSGVSSRDGTANKTNYEKKRNDLNLPSFPAYFTHLSKNQQQKKTLLDARSGAHTVLVNEIQKENNEYGTNSIRDSGQMRSDARGKNLSSLTIKRHSMGGGTSPFNGAGRTFHKSSARESGMNENRPSMNMATPPKFRPIRVQSVLAPYPNDIEIEKQPPLTMREQQKAARRRGNYKASYLNKPASLLQNDPSDTSSKFGAGQSIAEHLSQMPATPISIDNNTGAASYLGAVISQNGKMSFKDYIELQSIQAIQGRDGKYSKDLVRDLQPDGASLTVLKPEGNALFDSQISTLNNTFNVQRNVLQSLAPTQKVFESQTQHNQYKDNSKDSMKKFRRISKNESTVQREQRSREDPEMRQYSTLKGFDVTLDKTQSNFNPKQGQQQSRLKSINATSKTHFGAGHSPSGARLQNGGGVKVAQKTFTSVSQAPPEHTLEVTVVKGSKADQVPLNQESPTSLHFGGGKFQINIQKRASTQTITESNDGQHSVSKEPPAAKKSQLSTLVANTGSPSPVITPKYYAHISAMPEINKKKGGNESQAPQKSDSPPYFNSDLIPSSAENNDTDSIQTHHRPKLNLKSGVGKSKFVRQRAGKQHATIDNMQTHDSLAMASFLQTQQTVSPSARDTINQKAPNQPKHLSTSKSHQKQKNAKSVMRTPHALGPLNHALGEPQSPWERKKQKLSQPIMTAERIVEKNIRPYEKSPNRNYDPMKSQLQKANEQGIVVGMQKQIIESKRQPIREVKHEVNFLPELKQRHKTTHDQATVSNDVGCQDSRDGKRIYHVQEESDSISSPEQLMIVNYASEMLNGGHEDGDIQKIEGNISPRQERRQVIKILDQSKWRAIQGVTPGIEYSQHAAPTPADNQLVAHSPGTKTHTASTDDKRKNGGSSLKFGNMTMQRPDATMMLQEGSLYMGSVFERPQGTDSRLSITHTGPVDQLSGKKSHVPPQIEGQDSSSIHQMSNVMEGQIQESEREMKELIARENLIQDDMGQSTVTDKHFDTNVRVGIQSIFGNDDGNNFLNSTGYSQFIKNNDVDNKGKGGKQSKQDFNGQIQAPDYDHLYQTQQQSIQRGEHSISMNETGERLHPTKRNMAQSQLKIFSPPVNNKKKQNRSGQLATTNIGSTRNGQSSKLMVTATSTKKSRKLKVDEEEHVYPVGVHSRNNLTFGPIDKLRTQMVTQKHFQEQKQIFNSSFLETQINKTKSWQQQTILENSEHTNSNQHSGALKNRLRLSPRQNLMNTTTTRITQHQRAVAELRSAQQQLQIDTTPQRSPRQSQSPKSPKFAREGDGGLRDSTIGKVLQVTKSPQNSKPLSPQKLKQIAEREQRLARIEQMREKSEKLQQMQHGHQNQDIIRIRDQPGSSLKIEDTLTLDAHSARDLTTNMSVKTPLDFVAPFLNNIPESVVVNTSGSNTAFLPSPNSQLSPIQTATMRQYNQSPPFAIQQEKRFSSFVIEKSVLPEGKTYKYAGGRSKDGINKDIIEADPANEDQGDINRERAGSSIIANYQKQSHHEELDHSPKSYKMPANFPHDVDSQLDSVQGDRNIVNGEIGANEKAPILPAVHSFAHHAELASKVQKTQSSKVNYRRHILAEKKGSSKKMSTKNTQNDKYIGVDNTTIVAHNRDRDATGTIPLSNPDMPNGYDTQNDSIQNISQVQDLFEAVEKEMEENLHNGVEIDRDSIQQIDYEEIKAVLELQGSSDRATPDAQKQIERVNVEKSMLLSSAQTIEIESPPEHHMPQAQVM